jgi:hypothetical protein
MKYKKNYCNNTIIILDSIIPARSGKTRILLSVPKALFKRRWWQ